MQLALRRYATASVAVLGASLICVTPVTAPHIEQRAVDLATSETLSDLVGPTDAVVSSLGGLSGELSGVLPSLGDLSGRLADGASSATDLELLDPAFWELFWNALIDPSGESPGCCWWVLLATSRYRSHSRVLWVCRYYQSFCFWRMPGARFHRHLALTRVPPLPKDSEPACKVASTPHSRG